MTTFRSTAVLIFLVLAFYSCSRDDGIGCLSPDEFRQVDKGSARLKPGNEGWLNNSSNLVFTLNNVDVNFTVDSGKKRDLWRQIDHTTVTLSECDRINTSFIVQTQEHERLSVGSQLPFYFSETRIKDFTGVDRHSDSTAFDALPEILIVKVNYRKFIVPVETKDTVDNEWLPVVKLGTITYDSVYHCFSTNVNTGEISELYYKVGKGILAYRIIVNELWVRKF